LTVLAHNWYPRCTAFPESEKSPVSDTDAPITSGAVLPLAPDPPLDAQPATSPRTAVTSPICHKRLSFLI
jgi:hypothetical protein